MRQAELLYSPETLKFSGIDQARKQLAFVAVGLNPNDVVNRIAVYFFRQNALSPRFNIYFAVQMKF
jgi:hypothetical protein